MESLNLNKAKWNKRFSYLKVIGFQDKLPENVKFQMIKFDENAFVPFHVHLKTTEIYVVTDGNGLLFINKRKYKLTKDDIYLIEPHDWHAIEAQAGLQISIFKPYEEKKDIYWEVNKDC